MKLTKKKFSIILILLIGLNSITSTSLSIKSNKKSLSKRNRVKLSSKEASDFLLKKLKEQVTDPLNISYFVMGILSEWFPGVDKLHQEVKKIHKFFSSCEDFIKEAWAILHGKSISKNPAKKKEEEKEINENKEKKKKVKEQISKIEFDDKTQEQRKQEFCKNTKAALEKVWKIAVDELFKTKSSNEKKSKLLGANDEKPKQFCDFPLYSASALKEINDQFENKENFTEICIEFRENNDCSKFKPDNEGAWNFIKKTLKYGIFVKNGATCIVNLLKKGGKDDAKGIPENQEISKLANDALGAWSSIKAAFKEFGAFVAHILSFGVWGVLRAAYNLLKLGANIFKLAANVVTDFPYHIGKLVGTVIKIVKALLMGRRRRK